MHFDSFEPIFSGMLATPSYHFPWMLYENFMYFMYWIENEKRLWSLRDFLFQVQYDWNLELVFTYFMCVHDNT